MLEPDPRRLRTQIRRPDLEQYFRMNPNQLDRSQLDYELLLRQCAVEGTARVQANAVKAMLAHEQLEGTDLVHLDHSPLPPDIDLRQCTESVAALEAHIGIGRIDYRTLKTMWARSVHTNERLKRIRTAGPDMANLKEDLIQRALAVRLEAKRQRDPFQSPQPGVTSTPAVESTETATTSTGGNFEQMVQSTPDHPPVTSPTNISAIVSQFSRIYPTPTTTSVATERTSVNRVQSTPATETTTNETVAGAGAIHMSLPSNMTTEYRERVETPDGFRISDTDDEEDVIPRTTNNAQPTSGSFCMRPPILAVPP